MKIGHLLLQISVACAFFATAGKAVAQELGGPLPGRIRIKVEKEGVSKRMQISGSLNPLKVFVNGHDLSRELVKSSCSESGVWLNGDELKTNGEPGVFFHEGLQKEKMLLKLNSGKKCFALSLTMPQAFFEKPYKETSYLPENEKPSFWAVSISGDTIPNQEVELNQGELVQSGGVSTFNYEAKPGENIITGVIKDQTGKLTPLEFKITMDIQESSKDGPGLQLKIHEREEADEELRISGAIIPGHKLMLNGESINVSENGEFDHEEELSLGENELALIVEHKDKKLIHEFKAKRVEEKEKVWSNLPQSYYLGIAPALMHAMRLSEDTSFKTTEPFMAKIVFGIGTWEYFFRFIDEEVDIDQGRMRALTLLKKFYSVGAMKLYPYKKSFHYGFGASFGTLTKQEDGPKSTVLRDLNLIARAGWMWNYSDHWKIMSTFSPFIAIPIGEGWEKYGFEFSPLIITYAF